MANPICAYMKDDGSGPCAQQATMNVTDQAVNLLLPSCSNHDHGTNPTTLFSQEP
jgi:hypothetical protein